MDMNLQKQMAFNEKLNKLLEETQKKKPFHYDIVFIKNNEFKKGKYFASGKTQGTINGGKRCKLMVGCILGHCLEGD